MRKGPYRCQAVTAYSSPICDETHMGELVGNSFADGDIIASGPEFIPSCVAGKNVQSPH